MTVVETQVADQGKIVYGILSGNAETANTNTLTVGYKANNGNAKDSVIVGNNASTTKDGSTVVGSGATNTGTDSVVIGKKSSSTGNTSTVIGAGAQGSAENVVALGAGAIASDKNSVAIGAGSTTGGRENVVSFGAAGNERQITNVAAGTAATDAVNVSQLQSVGAEFGQRLNRQNKELSGGIASAVAMGMMPTLSEPGKMITGGTGLYNGEGAVAIGLTGTTQDSKITYKAGATFVTNGDASVGAGFGYRF